MNSSDEGSFEADFDPGGRERARVPQAGPGTRRGIGQGSHPGRQSPQSDMDSEEEVLGTGATRFWGSKGLPVFPGMLSQEGEDTVVFGPHIAVESAAIVEKLMSWQAQTQARGQARGARRFRSSESYAAKLSTIWGNVEAGPRGRGAPTPSCVDVQQVSAASLLRAGGPERGRAWSNPKRGTKTRMMVSRATPRSFSNQEFSDEFSEIQLMRGCLLTSAPRGLNTTMERQAAGELEISFSKKIQCIVWGKGETKPSHPGAVAAGYRLRATAREAIQQKNPLVGSSRVTLGRTFPPWGQRLKAAPQEPAAFPPVSDIVVIGKAKRFSLLPLGPKQSKNRGTGKRSVASRGKDFQPVFKEDTHLYQDGALQAHLLTRSPRPPTLCMQRGEFSSGDPNTRAPQPPGNTCLLAPRQGSLRCRGPISSGDREPVVHHRISESQHQTPGTQSCSGCVTLQKERDELKKQLAVMQALNEKLQKLGH